MIFRRYMTPSARVCRDGHVLGSSMGWVGLDTLINHTIFIRVIVVAIVTLIV